jgi:glycosyltransferase involved in cell wall biosynthesis
MEPAMTGEIEEALGLPSNAITVIPDPALSRTQIDHLRRAPRATRAPDTGRRFVAVGRLVSQKNLELMLRAFRRGANPHDVLVVIGDGPERAKLTKLAADLGLSDDVELRGYIAEPWGLLPEFDALLLSSNYEGVPAVVLEALAARLPVIATDCSRSMRQLLHNGALGTLVPVGDEATFAEAIARKGLPTPDAALSLAQVCRFTLEDAAEAYVQTMVGLASRTVASAAPSARDGIPLKPAQEPLGDIAA